MQTRKVKRTQSGRGSKKSAHSNHKNKRVASKQSSVKDLGSLSRELTLLRNELNALLLAKKEEARTEQDGKVKAYEFVLKEKQGQFALLLNQLNKHYKIADDQEAGDHFKLSALTLEALGKIEKEKRSGILKLESAVIELSKEIENLNAQRKAGIECKVLLSDASLRAIPYHRFDWNDLEHGMEWDETEKQRWLARKQAAEAESEMEFIGNLFSDKTIKRNTHKDTLLSSVTKKLEMTDTCLSEYENQLDESKKDLSSLRKDLKFITKRLSCLSKLRECLAEHQSLINAFRIVGAASQCILNQNDSLNKIMEEVQEVSDKSFLFRGLNLLSEKREEIAHGYDEQIRQLKASKDLIASQAKKLGGLSGQNDFNQASLDLLDKLHGLDEDVNRILNVVSLFKSALDCPTPENKVKMPDTLLVWDFEKDFESQSQELKIYSAKVAAYKNYSNAAYQDLVKLTVLMEEAELTLFAKGRNEIIFAPLQKLMKKEAGRIKDVLRIREMALGACSAKLEKLHSLCQQHEVIEGNKRKAAEYEHNLPQLESVMTVIKRFEGIHVMLDINTDVLNLYRKVLDRIKVLGGIKPAHEGAAEVMTAILNKFVTQYCNADPGFVSRNTLISLLNKINKLGIYLSLKDENWKSLFDYKKISPTQDVIGELLVLDRAGLNITDFLAVIANKRTLGVICRNTKDLENFSTLCKRYKVDERMQKALMVATEMEQTVRSRERAQHLNAGTDELSKCQCVNGVNRVICVLENDLTANDLSTLLLLKQAFSRVAELHTQGENEKKRQHNRKNNRQNRNVMSGSLADVFASLRSFLSSYKAQPKDLSNRHGYLIELLTHFNHAWFKLDSAMQEKIGQLLCFSHVVETRADICADILVCAHAGIDIGSAMEALMASSKLASLNERNLTDLLLACSLHDVNPDHKKLSISPIPQKTIDKLFDLTEQAYQPLVGGNEEDRSARLIGNFFHENKFNNGTTKSGASNMNFLQAASFYQRKLTQEIEDYLNKSMHLNDDSHPSQSQKWLFNFLRENLPEHIEVSEEKKLGCGFSADIYLFDTKTGKKIDVEFDGPHHFYRDENGQSIEEVKEEKLRFAARDRGVVNSGDADEVLRLTRKDIRPASKNVWALVNRLNGVEAKKSQRDESHFSGKQSSSYGQMLPKLCRPESEKSPAVLPVIVKAPLITTPTKPSVPVMPAIPAKSPSVLVMPAMPAQPLTAPQTQVQSPSLPAIPASSLEAAVASYYVPRRNRFPAGIPTPTIQPATSFQVYAEQFQQPAGYPLMPYSVMQPIPQMVSRPPQYYQPAPLFVPSERYYGHCFFREVPVQQGQYDNRGFAPENGETGNFGYQPGGNGGY